VTKRTANTGWPVIFGRVCRRIESLQGGRTGEIVNREDPEFNQVRQRDAKLFVSGGVLNRKTAGP
jgi:hypothetical protein